MKRHAIRAALVFGLLLLFHGVALGAKAEEKALETLSYKGLQDLLAANKGKVIVVNFFASWCPPCRDEIPSLIKIRQGYGEDALILIGASVDEDESALRAFMEKTDFNYPVMKSGLDLTMAAHVSSIPHFLIFTGAGEVAANQPGQVPEEELRKFIERIMEKK